MQETGIGTWEGAQERVGANHREVRRGQCPSSQKNKKVNMLNAVVLQ